jgi:hypothetical protein
MKYKSMINVIAGAGLVVAPLSVMAAGFGGGWVKDPSSGTVYYSEHQPVEAADYSGQMHSDGYTSDFGGGWAINQNSGTLYNSSHPPMEAGDESGQQHADGNMNVFGNGWAINEYSGTLYYSGHGS